MPGATLATLSNILKEFYLPEVTSQLNNTILLMNRLENDSESLYGNEAVVALHSSRSGGVGARPESGTLPPAGNQVYNKAVYDLKYLYGRVRVTGPSIAKTANSAGAFLKALSSELDGIKDDLKDDVARQIYGNGDSIIATTAANAAVTVIVLQSAEALTKGQLYVGAVVDIGTLANPVSRVDGSSGTLGVITAVNIATPSFTLGTAATTSAGEIVTRQGSAGAGSVSYEISGLKQLVSSSAGATFGGINSGTSTFWDNLRNTGGGALALDTMMQSWNRVALAGGEVSAIITSYGLQRAYYNLLQSKVQYVKPMELVSGFQTLEFMGKPLIADIDAPWGSMYFLDERFINIYSYNNWDFMNEDGNILLKVSGVDAYEAVLFRYLNLGTNRRGVQLVASGLTDTLGF